MADLGFLPNVRRILRATPQRGQRLLFSATLDNGVDALVKEFLHNPLQHSVDPSTSPVDAMTHRVWMVADKEWVAKGVTVVEEPHNDVFGRTFMISDPDGNLIRVSPVD